ncbi:MAG: hypothetical protein JNL11_10760 [Bdellovibrionaceae bacterium]|nr:hypothetical protein [Pseudobdellovibrionaceae bacterium]
MDDEQYKRLFKKAKLYAAKRGFGDESEDFAQEYAIKCLKSGNEECIEWDFIDYSDAQRADKRILSSPSGFLSKNVRVSLDAPIISSNENSTKLSDYIGVSGDELDNIGYDEQNKSVLTRREGMIYDLYFNQRHTLRDIGARIGVSESRVSQFLSEINRKISRLYEDGEILNLFLSKIDSKESRLLTISTFKQGIRKNVFKG